MTQPPIQVDSARLSGELEQLAREGRAALLTKHPLEPGEEEIQRNPASRSAKLRAVEIN